MSAIRRRHLISLCLALALTPAAAFAQNHGGHNGNGGNGNNNTNPGPTGIDRAAAEDNTTTTNVNAQGQVSTTSRSYDTNPDGYTLDTTTVNADGTRSSSAQSVTFPLPQTARISDSHGGLQNVTTFGGAPRSGGGYAPQAQTVSTPGVNVNGNVTGNVSNNGGGLLTNSPYGGGGSITVNAAPAPADVSAGSGGVHSTASYNGD